MPGTQPDISEVKKANLPVIYIIGGPGSGKATQAKKIQTKYGYTHISIGQLLRDEVKASSERGKKIKETLDKGELVSDDIASAVLKDAMIKGVKAGKPFLLHGFPRTSSQLKAFEADFTKTTGIFLDTPDAKMTERLTARGKTGARPDDKPEVVKKRIEIYNKDTKPMIDEMVKAGKAYKIAADGDVEKVFADIVKVLDERVAKKP